MQKLFDNTSEGCLRNAINVLVFFNQWGHKSLFLQPYIWNHHCHEHHLVQIIQLPKRIYLSKDDIKVSFINTSWETMTSTLTNKFKSITPLNTLTGMHRIKHFYCVYIFLCFIWLLIVHLKNIIFLDRWQDIVDCQKRVFYQLYPQPTPLWCLVDTQLLLLFNFVSKCTSI